MMERIEAELARIRERLVNHPHPLEHGALYAAQQALDWVLRPTLAAAPFDMITGFPEESREYCPTSRPELSAGTVEER